MSNFHHGAFWFKTQCVWERSARRMYLWPAQGTMYITGQVKQAALTATGRSGCAAGNAVDQRRGT